MPQGWRQETPLGALQRGVCGSGACGAVLICNHERLSCHLAEPAARRSTRDWAPLGAHASHAQQSRCDTPQDGPQDVAVLPDTSWCRNAGVTCSITKSRRCGPPGASRPKLLAGSPVCPLRDLPCPPGSISTAATQRMPLDSHHIEAALLQSVSPAWTASSAACIMCCQAAADILQLPAAPSPFQADLQGVAPLCPEPDPVEGGLPGLRALQPCSALPKSLGAGAILPARQQARAARVQVHLQVVGPVPDTAASVQTPAARSAMLSWLISWLTAMLSRLLQVQRRWQQWCTVQSKRKQQESVGHCQQIGPSSTDAPSDLTLPSSQPCGALGV